MFVHDGGESTTDDGGESVTGDGATSIVLKLNVRVKNLIYLLCLGHVQYFQIATSCTIHVHR